MPPVFRVRTPAGPVGPGQCPPAGFSPSLSCFRTAEQSWSSLESPRGLSAHEGPGEGGSPLAPVSLTWSLALRALLASSGFAVGPETLAAPLHTHLCI